MNRFDAPSTAMAREYPIVFRERKAAIRVVHEIFKTLGISRNVKILSKTIEEDENVRILADYCMYYIHGIHHSEKTTAEKVISGLWERLKDTPAKNIWLKECLDICGVKWVYENLNPSWEEKTAIMVEVLGKDTELCDSCGNELDPEYLECSQCMW